MENTVVKIKDAVAAYKTISRINLRPLKKELRSKVLRASNILRGVSTKFDEFVKDARERLKPEGWDETVEKAQRFDALPDEEKRAVNSDTAKYQNDIDEAVNEELEREAELKEIPGFSEEELLDDIAGANDLTSEQLLTVMDVCGE